jgi:hypothetical protein
LQKFFEAVEMQSAALEPRALQGILAKFAKIRRVVLQVRSRRDCRIKAALEARRAKRLAALMQAIQAAEGGQPIQADEAQLLVHKQDAQPDAGSMPLISR